MQRVQPVLVEPSIEEQLAAFPSSLIPFVRDPAFRFAGETTISRKQLKTMMRRRRTGFKRASMISSFGTQRRFGMATGRRTRQRRAQRIVPVVAGFTRATGFFGRFGQGGELKFHDVDKDDAVIVNGGSVTATLIIIPQGTTEIQRIGRKCTIRSINWRFQVSIPPINATGAAPSGDTVRVILYLDKQTNGATATVLNILETADYQSFNNLGNKSRFRTLMDRTYSLNYAAGSGSGGATDNDYAEVVFDDTFFKKVNIPIEYDNTTGAIGEIRSNNIGLLLITENGAGGLVSKFRFRFSDN